MHSELLLADEVLDWEACERCLGAIMNRLGVSPDDVVSMVMDDTLRRCHGGLAFPNRTPMDAMAPRMPIARLADDVVSCVLGDMMPFSNRTPMDLNTSADDAWSTLHI